MFEQWTNINLNSAHDNDVLSLRFSSCFSSNSKSLWNGLYGASSTGSNTTYISMETNTAIKSKIKQKDNDSNIGSNRRCSISLIIISSQKL
jgi:hypothetical protein